MDDLIEFLIEVFGDIVEAALESIKNPRKRKWALTIFYSFIVLAISGLCIWAAVSNAMEQNLSGAAVMGVIAGLLLTVFGFFIIRGHKRSWRKKNKELENEK